MKILITYFSQTGNTEKIAEAIHEIASKNLLITVLGKKNKKYLKIINYWI